MPRILFSLFIVLISSFVDLSAHAVCTKDRAVVLVPSGLRSINPSAPNSNASSSFSYSISSSIVQTTSAHVCHVMVAKDLPPEGGLQTNSLALLAQIQEWHNTTQSDPTLPIEIIAHGLGGLYALGAVSLDDRSTMPLKFNKIHLVATPLLGLSMVDLLHENTLVRDQMSRLFTVTYPKMELTGLWNLTSPTVQDFLDGLTISDSTEIHRYAAFQVSSENQSDELNGLTLAPVLAGLDFLNDTPGDRIVGRSAALAPPATTAPQPRLLQNMHLHDEYLIPLDHLETMTDAEELKQLGFKNTDQIDRLQREWVQYILETE